MNEYKLIAFAGRKRSGKGLLTNAIVEYNKYYNRKNTVVLTVASYLKNLCCELLYTDIETLNKWKDNGHELNVYIDDRGYKLINNRTGISIDIIKNEIDNINFTNVRQLLQVIGTDLIRKYNPTWHIDCLEKDIEDYITNNDVIVDDVRFPNEREIIEKHNGKVFFIIRPDYFDISNHISETSLKWQDFKDENIIINDLDKKSMEIYIQTAYANDFEITNLPILLSGSEHFKINTNPSFPTSMSNKKLVENILQQCLKDDRFIKKGIIHYTSPNRTLRDLFNSEVMLSECNNWQRDYVIYNPLINENLKIYM